MRQAAIAVRERIVVALCIHFHLRRFGGLDDPSLRDGIKALIRQT